MPRRPSATRRWITALRWPGGVAMTSWDYMWRTTPMHRREVPEGPSSPHLPPPFPAGVDRSEVQGAETGHGPLFHRRYRTRIRESDLTPVELMAELKRDLNRAAPRFARFQRVLGDSQRLALGDEYVVRMPGPWDGPVRVIRDREDAFTLATLDGHLEAGQIEFRAIAGDSVPIVFEIESWARSGDRLSNLLYHHAHMAKEIQLHMWISFLEGVVSIAGGKMDGGLDIDTRRIDGAFPV
jgi:hypothetical protein